MTADALPVTREQLVMWPSCEDCKSTGVVPGRDGAWPAECTACQTRRANAVTKARADLRAARRST